MYLFNPNPGKKKLRFNTVVWTGQLIVRRRGITKFLYMPVFIYTSFYICLVHTKGLFSGVPKSLSIRRPIYKPNDILVCEQSKALRNVAEKRKNQDRMEVILLSR